MARVPTSRVVVVCALFALAAVAVAFGCVEATCTGGPGSNPHPVARTASHAQPARTVVANLMSPAPAGVNLGEFEWTAPSAPTTSGQGSRGGFTLRI